MHHATGKYEVGEKARQLVRETWQSEANLAVFLGMLVVLTFVFPLTSFVNRHVSLYIDVGYTLMLISGVAIAWRTRPLFYVAVAVGTATLAVRWADWWYPSLGAAREVLMLASILLVTGILLGQVFSKGHVSAMRIQGAVAVYLLFGIAWAHAYQITNASHPGAFLMQHAGLNTVSEWLYFSFMTLTTVGYGDIVPVGPVARVLAMSEALTGQIYLTVLLARLVALQVSESTGHGPAS